VFPDQRLPGTRWDRNPHHRSQSDDRDCLLEAMDSGLKALLEEWRRASFTLIRATQRSVALES